MASQPVLNPTIPYVGDIDGGFVPGKLLRLQGVVPQNSQRFNVNLQTGGDGAPKDDVSLHVSVRLAEGYVARNSYENGSWGAEEGDGQLPIYPGQRFEIIVLCEEKSYKVAINGRHYCEFSQRVSHTRVTHLSITGDVQIALIVYESMPSVTGNTTTSTRTNNLNNVPLDNEPLPAGFEPNAPVPGGTMPPQGGVAGGQYQPPGYGAPPPPQQYQQQQQQGGGGYGPPFNQGYGYGPPPPPPGTQGGKEESGLESILESASTALMGAIGSGAADKLIGLISGGGSGGPPNQQQQQPPPYSGGGGNNPYVNQPQQQPQQTNNPPFHPSQIGGQGSIGGLGSVGSLLTSFAEDLLSGKKNQQH